jgi:hypothetical protein
VLLFLDLSETEKILCDPAHKFNKYSLN